MIIDSLANAEQYFPLHRKFKKAFAYINSIDLASIEPGKYEVDGDFVKAIFSNKQGMSAAESILKFECHDKHIDIQLVIKGKETIGWKSRSTCSAQKGEYNPEKDVVFYNDAPDMYFTLSDLQFVIFYPGDVHAPMIAEDAVQKLVIKVRI
ncbi:MAG: YhcH/YjgK/YiaL family protein [Bacteroidota bacterium]|nr:YhcH/YjgK/YiaL family protein [Ferruginibacter sp.]